LGVEFQGLGERATGRGAKGRRETRRDGDAKVNHFTSETGKPKSVKRAHAKVPNSTIKILKVTLSGFGSWNLEFEIWFLRLFTILKSLFIL
jgi:hypothetical protein